MKLGYYPGCTLHTSAREYDLSIQSVCQRLGIELVEIEDWNCCGALEVLMDKKLSIALSARNIYLAQDMGLDLVIGCSICSHNLQRADLTIREDENLKKEIEKKLGEYRGVRIRHLLDVISELNLEEKIVNPLKVKTVPYYGCLLVRASEVTRFDDPENPQSLDRLIKTVGAECLDYPFKARCCGANLMMSNPDYSFKMAGKLLEAAKSLGADCMVVACPMCHMLLDGHQKMMEKALGEEFNLPVLYFTQFLGLALGIPPRELGLDKNMVPLEEVIA